MNKRKAFSFPSYPAVYSARAIVYMITGEDIPECPVDFASGTYVCNLMINKKLIFLTWKIKIRDSLKRQG
ncbi:MAG: hypothetical protein ABIJ97_10815 [Bacteroidota bacterium]